MKWQINRAREKIREEGAVSVAKAATDYASDRVFSIHPYYRITNIYHHMKRRGCCRIMNEDWDYLIILDACRFDAFQEVNDISGSLESRWSCASNTSTFLQENFYTRELHDTVYVTANPKGANLTTGSTPVFHNTFTVLDNWSDEHPTVHPDEVTKIAKDAYNEHNDKKMIIHYMQPHAPFIGEKAAELHKKLDGLIIPEAQKSDGYTYNMYENNDDISKEDIYDTYLESLDIVLKSCKELIDEVDGKVVITADHGELFNEKIGPLGKKVNGHPMYIKSKNLNKVPWFIIPSSQRPEIKREKPVMQEDISEDMINERLRDLGYK